MTASATTAALLLPLSMVALPTTTMVTMPPTLVNQNNVIGCHGPHMFVGIFRFLNYNNNFS